MASREIIDFMLGKAKKSSHDESTSALHPSAPRGVPSSPSLPLVGTPSPAKHEPPSKPKGRSSVGRAFAKCLAEWVEEDETAHQILGSIANLRERIWYTSRLANRLRETNNTNQTSNNNNNAPQSNHGDWTQFGYRRTIGNNSYRNEGTIEDEDTEWTAQDLGMALDHGLRQHERMLAELRSTMALLGSTQDALGRRLDEYYNNQYTSTSSSFVRGTPGEAQCTSLASSGGDTARPKPIVSLETCSTLFVATSKELYRKQMLVEQVIQSSVTDSLLYRSSLATADGNDDMAASMSMEGVSSRQVAHQCCSAWPREHRTSHLLDVCALLSEMQEYYSGSVGKY